jgi:phosphoglycolate phosphatase-like HAD superfamily hydrolase
MFKRIRRELQSLALISIVARCSLSAAQDPLPSWNDGPVKSSITKFVDKVTTEGGPDFVRPAERIATFDNDGTLWCEQPMYFQMMFAFDRIKALAPDHPEWKDQEPFKAVLTNDLQAFGATGQKGLLEVIATTHAGMTVEKFHAIVRKWMHTARHPRFDRPYDQLTYQPMHELLVYLRSKGFKTFIVSGGGVEFMRPWAPKAYGIPPQQIVGSSGVVKFKMRDGTPVLLKEAKVEFIDDGPGKPVGINRFIGRRPVMAFGNSDGDLEMLQWTTEGEPDRKLPGFALIVHHTDAVREYAYDRDSKVGRLDKAWDEGIKKGWTIVDMKNDWKQIFPPEQKD